MLGTGESGTLCKVCRTSCSPPICGISLLEGRPPPTAVTERLEVRNYGTKAAAVASNV